MKRIFIAGSINTDLVITAPYMPAAGETLAGGGFFTARGGKGANQATAAARLGGAVTMCARVGDDGFGGEAVASLESDGVDVSQIRACRQTSTGTAVIVVTDGDNRIILDAGANALVCESDIDALLLDAKSGDIFLTQLEIPFPTVEYAAKKAHEKEMFVILNPAPAKPEAARLLQYCDLAVPNQTETDILGGRAEVIKKTAGDVIITLGADGFELCRSKGGDCRIYPAPRVTAVDTTAAGDTFCGGLAARLAAGEPLEQAACFASAAASLACTRKGAQPSIPSLEQTRKFIGGAKAE